MDTTGEPRDEDTGGDDAPGTDGRGTRSNFLRDIVDADLAAGRHTQVVTRFPPEPNGWMHIGHAKAIWVSYGIARDYGGIFRLRFDDTNPLTEDTQFVDAIADDIAWLGTPWEEPIRHASDYFEFMYESAVVLVEKGLAYVDDQPQDLIAAGRGTISEPGTPSPCRERPVAENRDLLARMRAGEFPDGARVLRAKIDMAAANMLMRDPLLYRIRHARHHRTGDAWCIYPLYDFAHCLEDAYEGVTHSFCSLEFETRRPLYDWILDNVLAGEALARRPHQYEFARLALPHTITSKRKLIRLIQEGHVDGWDDPRLVTLAGLRRRGVTPEAIHDFCSLIGVARANSTVDIGKLEYAIREDLNHRAPRVMCVLRPLEVVITNWSPGHVEKIEAPLWPHDVPKEGSRTLHFGRRLYVERDDYMDEPPAGWHRLAPGREVRLRHGYVIRVDDVERDDAGEPIRLLCTYDPATRSGNPVGRKVRGTVHWVSADHAVRSVVRLYDRLFSAARPGEDRDFVLDLNPDSLEVLAGAYVEPAAAHARGGTRYQFERLGYFVTDEKDSLPGAPVWNRIVTLRDTWAKLVAKSAARDIVETADPLSDTAPAPTPAPTPAPSPQSTVADERVRARAASPILSEAYDRYTQAWNLEADDADRLTGDEALVAFFDAAVTESGDAGAVANWVVNELLRDLKERSVLDLPFDGAAFGRLVDLVEGGSITAAAGKEVLVAMVAGEGEPRAIVERRGLRQMRDEDALLAIVDDVLAAHADDVARYKDGKTSLLGFFMGQVMRASKGKANPGLTKELLARRLDGTNGR